MSLFWTVVLERVLPRRHPLVSGSAAGAAIAAFDLLVVGRRFPRVRALPFVPQLADHVVFGVTVALVLRGGTS